MEHIGQVSLQRVIGLVLLAAGLFYACLLICQAHKEKESFEKEKGLFRLLIPGEAMVYFIATLGISDFLQNTLLIKTLKLTDDKKLPGTLVTCGLVPGAVIAFLLLRADNPISIWTLLPCCVAVTAGSLTGARIIRRMDGKKIKGFMRIALIISLIVLIIRILFLPSGEGSESGLNVYQMIPAVLLAFLWGLVGMAGIPMKPAGTALFLLLGLSPLSTLTMVLVLGCLAPLSGGVPVIRSKQYHQKLAISSVVGGSVGALLGSAFAIAIDQTLLYILLLGVMLLAIFSMFKK